MFVGDTRPYYFRADRLRVRLPRGRPTRGHRDDQPRTPPSTTTKVATTAPPPGSGSIGPTTSLEDLLVDLRLGMEKFGPSLVVLDSISSIEHASSEKGFRQFMIGVASILRQHGRSALLTQTVMSGEANEMAVASTRICSSAKATGPLGASTPSRQPASANGIVV